MVNIKNTLFFTTPLLIIISIPASGRMVSHIDINGTGLYDNLRKDSNQERLCKGFRPSKKQLTHFFNLATESKSHGTLLHEYYSPCLATGLVQFQDGASGNWTVQSSGLAFVSYDNGESATFFYKDNKWTDPYACSYGMSDEGDC